MKLTGLVPARFLTIVAHLIIVIVIFWSRVRAFCKALFKNKIKNSSFSLVSIENYVKRLHSFDVLNVLRLVQRFCEIGALFRGVHICQTCSIKY